MSTLHNQLGGWIKRNANDSSIVARYSAAMRPRAYPTGPEENAERRTSNAELQKSAAQIRQTDGFAVATAQPPKAFGAVLRQAFSVQRSMKKTGAPNGTAKAGGGSLPAVAGAH